MSDELEMVEVTLSFLVAHLDRHEQNLFLGEMDDEGFGLATEGTYQTTCPPILAEKLPRTASFTFYSVPEGKGVLSEAVATCIKHAQDIAQPWQARLLSAGFRMEQRKVA